ncbi:glycosyltransferase family 2 protein [Pelagibaculum spongiae]|uniref:Glycosyl transferase n=1 Tax=Pelagibaculum spongiae TaxID=2080658 RepID=A0A2V1GXN1_9GAMM|nr:glycosyltransferase family 2 protein [Pelagibaculum spongiae]PVZ71854.1 glycosyl transferase [Pelagibaculum spongiae]
MSKDLTIILPAKNEANTIGLLLDQLVEKFPLATVIVVNDGSSDDTGVIAKQHGVSVISHPYCKGNGAAIKTGTRQVRTQWIATMDADGQHQAQDLMLLYKKAQQGFDMVVGARNKQGQASIFRLMANKFYNTLASWITGHKIQDLTSGMRVVRTDCFRRFLYLFPNGFSYPTTSTMAFFRAGYSVTYQNIDVKKRVGKSHIKMFRDGARFLLIIFKVGTLYSPLKLFTPISLVFFVLGLAYYGYTFSFYSRFTNMSALLLITSVLIFLIGIVSEQITVLQYSKGDVEDE